MQHRGCSSRIIPAWPPLWAASHGMWSQDEQSSIKRADRQNHSGRRGAQGPGSAGARRLAAGRCTPGPFLWKFLRGHAHLSNDDAIALFGEVSRAPSVRFPSPGMSSGRVRLIGVQGRQHQCCFLLFWALAWWPQVEIPRPTLRILGINSPVRQSGDTKETPGVILASATGSQLEHKASLRPRAAHPQTDDARRFGLHDKDMVDVRPETERPMILENVLVRVSDDCQPCTLMRTRATARLEARTPEP